MSEKGSLQSISLPSYRSRPLQKAHVPHVRLELDVLQRLLEVGDEQAWWNKLVVHFCVRHSTLVGKGECRVFESCALLLKRRTLPDSCKYRYTR